MKNFFSKRAKGLASGLPPVGFFDFGVEGRVAGHRPGRIFCRVRFDYLAKLIEDLKAAADPAQCPDMGALCIVITEDRVQVEVWKRPS